MQYLFLFYLLIYLFIINTTLLIVFLKVKEAHYKNNPEWKWSSKEKKASKNLKPKVECTSGVQFK